MVGSWLGDRALWALEQALRGVAARHQAIVQNVANVETPGYARQDVLFRDALRAALDRGRRGLVPWRTHERHLSLEPLSMGDAVEPRVVRTNGPGMRADGNTVNLDQEMAQMAQNALDYQVLSRQIAVRLSALRTVIHEGRR